MAIGLSRALTVLWIVGPVLATVGIVALYRWGFHGIRNHGAAVNIALGTAERFDWIPAVGPVAGAGGLAPADPHFRRTIIEHLREPTGETDAGQVLLASETPRGGGAAELVFYVLMPVDASDSGVVYCRSLASVSRTHGSGGDVGDRVVAAIRSEVPDVRMAWVADGRVGLGIDARGMTNPVAWAGWLADLPGAVRDGRRLRDCPASW